MQKESIEYIKSFTAIKNKTLWIIQFAHKLLLSSKDGPWIAKENSLFDVTMVSFAGAAIYEILF